MDKKCHQASANEMSNSTGSNFDNKKLTFDPPTRLTKLTQNVIRSSHGHPTPSLKISCKSVQLFSRNVADKETKKERNKERKKSPKNNTPPPAGDGVISNKQAGRRLGSRVLAMLML